MHYHAHPRSSCFCSMRLTDGPNSPLLSVCLQVAAGPLCQLQAGGSDFDPGLRMRFEVELKVRGSLLRHLI